jgi:hypothetical protein
MFRSWKWKGIPQQFAAECHRASKKFANEYVCPKSRLEFSASLIVRSADLIAILIDEERIACYKRQAGIMVEGGENGLYLIGKPNIVLIAKEDDLSRRAGKSCLEGSKNSLIFTASDQNKTRIADGRHDIASLIGRGIIHDDYFVAERQLE